MKGTGQAGQEGTTINGASEVRGLPTRLRQLHYLPILFLAIAIIVIVIIFVKAPTDYKAYINAAGYPGVLLMGIIGCVSPIWPLPGWLAAFIAGGLGLTAPLVALVVGFGEAIGEFIAYMGGYGGQVAVTKWKKYERIESWMKRHGGLPVFLLSTIPNPLTKFVVISAGTLRYPWRKFFLLCWAGKAIKSFGFAFAGIGLFDLVVNVIKGVF